MKVTTCLQAVDFQTLLAGTMNPEYAAEAEQHLSACEICREAMERQIGDHFWWVEAEGALRQGEWIEHEDTYNDGAPNPAWCELLGPTDDPNALGRIGPYEIVGLLGQGGMGTVFKGFDRSLNRFIAVKVMLPHLAASAAARKRFAREARAAAAVVNDHVLPIYGVDQWHGIPYLVSQFVCGQSLQKRLHHEGPLELEEILRIGLHAALGLAAAHAQGLVHRDVKPSNILLDGTVDRALLTDFGLARAVDDASMTRSGYLAGTPQYMSPEQARGEAVDQRSDLFSLGSLLYTMATGRPPFQADTSLGILRLIDEDRPRGLREVNSNLPAWLAMLVDKLMAKRPADRFQSAEEVANLLQRCLAHLQQPKTETIPRELLPKASWVSRRFVGIGVWMLLLVSLLGLGRYAWQVTSEPEDIIEGSWTGENWHDITMERDEFDDVRGAFIDRKTHSKGTFTVEWSRLQQRYIGPWRSENGARGKLSLRLVGDEIRGARTVRQAKDDTNTSRMPLLGDVSWKRAIEATEMTATEVAEAVYQAIYEQNIQGLKRHLADRNALSPDSPGWVKRIADLISTVPLHHPKMIVEADRAVALFQSMKSPEEIRFQQGEDRLGESCHFVIELSRLNGIWCVWNVNLWSEARAKQWEEESHQRELARQQRPKPRPTIHLAAPSTEAEKALASLEFVFYQDKARRKVPAVLVDTGEGAIAVTSALAVLAPPEVPQRIEHTFIDAPTRDSVEARYVGNGSTKELAFYRTDESLGGFRLDEVATLEVGDSVSVVQPGSHMIILNDAAVVTKRNAWMSRSVSESRNERTEYRDLVVVNGNLPPGTVVFKEGKLAGIVLWNTGANATESFVIPASRVQQAVRGIRASDSEKQR
ncbi:serine/threonine-protein kinase [Blastopirellula marina]|uniref:non-specific serine/threonine protein kinase n=1 Tax=Blastopirellula marina TaxID=124 RepID=A0A2S8G2E8_9BACT|nr:serine/threonine-protein kinase [Blastopirellula marina]PQO38616.1 hypothetical protein C5Y98_11265 [Blastopirellula marina]PTL45273.1 serine/threonine protein kinase [Blastopirellula marina]